MLVNCLVQRLAHVSSFNVYSSFYRHAKEVEKQKRSHVTGLTFDRCTLSITAADADATARANADDTTQANADATAAQENGSAGPRLPS